MITLIPIEPLNQAHGTLIVAAFNRHFVDKGGQQDGWGYGIGDGFGWGNGNGDGRGNGYGFGHYDNGNGRGDGWDDKCPEEWRAE